MDAREEAEKLPTALQATDDYYFVEASWTGYFVCLGRLEGPFQRVSDPSFDVEHTTREVERLNLETGKRQPPSHPEWDLSDEEMEEDMGPL